MTLIASGPADITVTFVAKLSGRAAGSTAEKWDTAGFIDHATVLLSEHTPKSLLHEALLHELGHAVGLDHAPRPGQVMDPVLTGQKDYQAGDLAGLRALGPLGQPAPASPG
jgi:predicted Zn-dependent protease